MFALAPSLFEQIAFKHKDKHESCETSRPRSDVGPNPSCDRLAPLDGRTVHTSGRSGSAGFTLIRHWPDTDSTPI